MIEEMANKAKDMGAPYKHRLFDYNEDQSLKTDEQKRAEAKAKK